MMLARTLRRPRCAIPMTVHAMSLARANFAARLSSGIKLSAPSSGIRLAPMHLGVGEAPEFRIEFGSAKPRHIQRIDSRDRVTANPIVANQLIGAILKNCILRIDRPRTVPLWRQSLKIVFPIRRHRFGIAK